MLRSTMVGVSAPDEPSTPFSTLDEIIARLDALGVAVPEPPPAGRPDDASDHGTDPIEHDAVDSEDVTDGGIDAHGDDPDDAETVIDLRTRIDLRTPSTRISDAARLAPDEMPPAISADHPAGRARRDRALEVARTPVDETSAPAADAPPPTLPDEDTERLPPLDLRPPRPVADNPPPTADAGRPKLEIVRPDGWTAAEIDALSTEPAPNVEQLGLRRSLSDSIPPAQLPLDRALPRLEMDPVDISRPEDELDEARATRRTMTPTPAAERQAFSLRDIVLMCLYAAVVMLTIAIAITLL